MKKTVFVGVVCLFSAVFASAEPTAPIDLVKLSGSMKPGTRSDVDILHDYEGTWRGKINVLNAAREVLRSIDSVQTYKWVSDVNDKIELRGESTYTILKDGKNVSVTTTSVAYVVGDHIFSEMVQNGKKTVFTVNIGEDNYLIYVPQPPKGEEQKAPSQMTSTHVETKGGRTTMSVRGYERVSMRNPADGTIKEGVILIEGVLEKVKPAVVADESKE